MVTTTPTGYQHTWTSAGTTTHTVSVAWLTPPYWEGTLSLPHGKILHIHTTDGKHWELGETTPKWKRPPI